MWLDHDYLYTFPSGMAMAYLFFGTKNHVFNDGNKRTAFAACAMFLLLNNYRLNAPDRQLVEFVVDVASSKTDKQGVINQVTAWLEPFDTEFTPDTAMDYILYYYDEVFRELKDR